MHGQRAWSYLGVGQHDIFDQRQAAGLPVLHAHVVDLVATDLPVLFPRRQGAPHHLEGGGVEHVHVHPPGRSAGHCGLGKQANKINTMSHRVTRGEAEVMFVGS